MGRSSHAGRRAALTAAGAALFASTVHPPAGLAAKPLVSEVVAALDKETSTRNADGLPAEHVPRISFYGAKVTTAGLSSQVEFTVPVEVLAGPNHQDDFIEYMWLKDAESGKILAAKRLRASDPSPPTLVASVAKGARVTAVSRCSRHGIWQGTFTVQ